MCYHMTMPARQDDRPTRNALERPASLPQVLAGLKHTLGALCARGEIMEKNCCRAARAEMIRCLNVMISFSPISPFYRSAEEAHDAARSHLNLCALPRRRKMANRIVAKATEQGGR